LFSLLPFLAGLLFLDGAAFLRDLLAGDDPTSSLETSGSDALASSSSSSSVDSTSSPLPTVKSWSRCYDF
jgi:hypothetical protein